MDGAAVKQCQGTGQDVIPPLNRDLAHIFNIHLVKEGILKYLDDSARINLSSVNRGIRQLVTSSVNYKKKAKGEDKTEVKLGQDNSPIMTINHDLSHILNIHLVKEEILKYLDGSALINLSLVNKEIREPITSSLNYKNKVNLRVNTESLDFFNTTIEPLPDWTANLTHLTLVCNSELVFVSPDKYSSLSRTLPSLSTLVLLSDSELESSTYAATFINKILNLSSKLKSLSLPYDLIQNPIDFQDYNLLRNLEELKFTTSSHSIKNVDRIEDSIDEFDIFCNKLKSIVCEEVVKVKGRYENLAEEDYHDTFKGILSLIQTNAKGLEKLEFGISQLLVANQNFSSKLAEISLPNLKYLDLRAVKSQKNYYTNTHQSVRVILMNLPNPGQLTTLKLSFTTFPIQLIQFIPQKFPQLKSLSLKSAKFNTGPPGGGEQWSFLQSLTELEELEIIKFKLKETSSNVGLQISQNFPDFLQNTKLRKLSLKGAHQVGGSTFFSGISKMSNLNELRLTGFSINLDDFLTICRNLKALEKLEISHLHDETLINAEYKYNQIQDRDDWASPKTTTTTTTEILTLFSSLKYLKELSIEVWSGAGDFREVLGSISFPYLKKLTLCNANLTKDQVENIIRLNGMLKELSIVRLEEVGGDLLIGQKFKIDNERNNLKIDFSSKQKKTSPRNRFEAREDGDPDSKLLSDINITWPAYEYSQDRDVDDWGPPKTTINATTYY